jgi:hypothetical protein
MNEWYLRIEGTDYGPYSLEQLVQYAGEGRINPGNFVRQTTSSDWMEAHQIPELADVFTSVGEISAAAEKSEPPPAPAVKKHRRKNLLRRPLFWIVFFLVLVLVVVYLGFVVITNLPYIHF